MFVNAENDYRLYYVKSSNKIDNIYLEISTFYCIVHCTDHVWKKFDFKGKKD